MKPDWSKAPEWANYVAMDDDGYWYWHENKPVITFDCSWVADIGRSEQCTEIDYVWRETLEKRP